MTSKEALNNLRFAVSIAQDLPYKECNDLCDIILKDLERLEVLELSNKTLDQICETQHEENEKLIKAINYEIELLIERRFNAYACDNYEVYNVIDAIIEELKEVLDECNQHYKI